MDEPRVVEEIEEHVAVARALVAVAGDVDAAARRLAACYRRGGKLLACGNGGSAADAQHIAGEFVGRFLRERDALPALALTVNTSALTAIANDYGYERVFERGVEAHGRAGDVLLALSTSGDSENVLRAARAARRIGLEVVAFTGRTGGRLAEHADVCVRVPSESTPRIQEMHILLGHIVSGLVEDTLA